MNNKTDKIKSIISEAKALDRFLLSRGIDPRFVTTDQKISHTKSGEFIKWLRDRKVEEVESEDEVMSEETPQEKFKSGLKKSGYDPDKGAKRLTDLIAKQKKEREEHEKQYGHLYAKEGTDYSLVKGQSNNQYKNDVKLSNGYVTKVAKQPKDDYDRKVDKYLKKKYNKEEVEQVDELNKSTVKSYLNKKINKPGVPSQKDVTGIARASERLMGKKPTTEEVEIEEGLLDILKKPSKKQDAIHYIKVNNALKTTPSGKHIMKFPDKESAEKHAAEHKKMNPNHNVKVTTDRGTEDPTWHGGTKTRAYSYGMREENEIEENHIAIAMGKMMDDESSMVLNQLDQMERDMKMIRDYIGKDYEKQLPAWVQSKVTLAADYIDTVGNYLNSTNEEVKEPTGQLKDACWKGYTAVGMKMKNGKKVPNCVPTKESFEEEHGISDKKERSKSARIIKSIYKRKNMKEDIYDHEKDDKSTVVYGKKPKMSNMDDKAGMGENKPEAAAVMSGGTTLTGQSRDVVEIDPMMRKRPGQPDPTKK